jgi:hypothetical protein
MELVIADPATSANETVKNSFQTIFTKCTKSSNAISHSEMCQRLLKNLDTDRRAVRFLMKQFVNDVNNQGQRSGNVVRAFESLKKEHTQLKQASSSQRLQMEQTIADLQHRVQALNGTVQEQQKKVQDKDKQLTQFRELYQAEGMARVPSSSHSQSSGGKRGGSSHMASHHHQQQQQQQQQQPPMQGFVMQKHARERAKEQAQGEFTRGKGPIIGGRPRTNESLMTPMQLPRRPLSSGSAVSDLQSVPNTPRIRDLSSSNGYVFTSGPASRSGHHAAPNGNKRPRHESPSGGGFAFSRQQQQQQHQQQTQSNYAPRFNNRG